jgi:tripartite-type tricarboxylate transporter receptor subunit TctC
MGTVGVISMLNTTYTNYGVEPLKDFVPVTKISDYPNALVAHSSVPANSFADLTSLAKARPGELTYVLISATSIHNLEIAALMREAGIRLKGIPESSGSGSAMKSIVDGKVNLVMTTAPYVLPHVRSGAIKALAIASDQRYFAFPGVPTFKEVGVPSVPIGSWMGLFVPAGTPKAIVNKLHVASKRAAEDADVKRVAADEGMIVSTSESPDAFRRFVENDTVRVIATVKSLGIAPHEGK